MISSAICLVINSWLFVWVILEVNTLAFCSLRKTLFSWKKGLSEWGLKYFIIQSIASSILVLSCLYTKRAFVLNLVAVLGVISIILKAGGAPFHQWFVDIVKKINWKIGAVLITWQKLAPVYLLVFQLKKVAIIFILASMVVGAFLQFNKLKVLEILGLSSVFNLGWIIVSLIINSKLFFLFLTLYWISVLIVVFVFSNSNLKTIYNDPSTKNAKWFAFISIVNLAGIPPLGNFLVKIFIAYERVKIFLVLLFRIIIVVRRINLYIYIRMANRILIKNRLPRKNNKEVRKTGYFLVLILTTFPLFIFAS